ncbi:efflux RND transporter permease subunit [Natronobacterium gregoryi]|uniref:efflux RND transporter permease subunit n=1 Tax=Natronobacterium gregoryi TaxID=44930 RepID=UPI00373AF16C
MTNRPWTVVAVFFVLTGFFVTGIVADAGIEAGDDQFTEGTESEQAFEEIQEDFERGDRDTGAVTAQLVVDTDRNVLAKQNLLRILTFQDRIETREELRVESTTSSATFVAKQLDPAAETPEEMSQAVEEASPRQLRGAIADADAEAELPVSTDFTRQSARAAVTQVGITYDLPPNADTDVEIDLLDRTEAVANSVDGFDSDDNILLFGEAIVEQENEQLLGDSAAVVFPASIVLILFFLIVAYRDPFDLALGLVSLLLTFVWTFGFMGLAGIPFSESIITVFALILAVGIDFGIHSINRYREERTAGADIDEAMVVSTRQLLIAFVIVALTTTFSFGANIVSDQTQNFGIVASAGVIFTFLIFSLFLPAGKVGLDRARADRRIPAFGTKPILSEGSLVARGLSVGVSISRVAPAMFLVVMLVFGGSVAVYGTGVDADFDEEVFFPEQERVEQYQELPAPLGVDEYVFIEYLEYIEEDFEIPFEESVTIYVDDPDLREGDGLSEIDRALHDPPAVYQSENRQAEANSILGVIESHAESDPEFADTVTRYDATGDEIPNRELATVYDELFASAAGDDARDQLTTDYTATRIDIQLTADADQDAVATETRRIADGMQLDAVATGQLVIFEDVAEETTEAAIVNLVLASLLTGIVLVIAFRSLEERAVYGLLNLVPVLGSVALLVATMRYLDIALSPITAPILAVAIGLGVDYTVHFMHRFVDEYETNDDVFRALVTTVRGTGGALTGSMITTVSGLGILYVALIPVLIEFGLLLALGVFYAWLSAIVVLPSAIVVWDRLADRPDS